MVRNVNVDVKVDFFFNISVNLSGDCQISSVGNCLPRICRGVEGVVGEVKSVSWRGARTKGEAHKQKLTLFQSDLFTSLSFYLTPLFLRFKNLRCQLMRLKS